MRTLSAHGTVTSLCCAGSLWVRRPLRHPSPSPLTSSAATCMSTTTCTRCRQGGRCCVTRDRAQHELAEHSTLCTWPVQPCRSVQAHTPSADERGGTCVRSARQPPASSKVRRPSLAGKSIPTPTLTSSKGRDRFIVENQGSCVQRAGLRGLCNNPRPSLSAHHSHGHSSAAHDHAGPCNPP